MIVNDGWTTKLTIRNVARPVAPLSTTPTGHLTNRIPIVPSKSNVTLANSLYECSDTGRIRSAKQDEIYGASNIVLPCPGSWVIFHLVEDVVIILKSSI
jgi:hypothetical protein